MARVAGITIEKDVRGNARYARIDLRKYGELFNPILKEVGVDVPVAPNKVTRKAIFQAKNGIGLKKFNSKEDLFKHWDNGL